MHATAEAYQRAIRAPVISSIDRIAGTAERKARDYVDMVMALDAPFEADLKAAAIARMDAKLSSGGAVAAARSAAAAAPPLGLVLNETSQTRIAIDQFAKRIKRMRTAVQHSARLIDFDTGAHGQRWNKKLITLTYADVDGWEPKHISSFTDTLRKWCKRRGTKCRIVWVAELQQRGAVHYHAVVWLPRGQYMPEPDKAGWWPHGSTNIKAVTNPTAYISKYASKAGPLEAAQMPKGARMHGACGLDDEAKRHIRYWQSPMWVRDGLHGTADIRKIRGGYVDKFTGEFLPSPWTVVFQGGKAWAVLKAETHTNQSKEIH